MTVIIETTFLVQNYIGSLQDVFENIVQDFIKN